VLRDGPVPEANNERARVHLALSPSGTRWMTAV